jgi:hypothetical protein
VSAAGMVIMQSWPVGNSHTCAGEPLGCIGDTGRRKLRQRRNPPAAAGPRGEIDQLLGDGLDVDGGFAVFGDHRVEVHQVGDPIRDPVGRRRDDQPRVAVPREHHLGETLIVDQPDDVVDVGIEPDIGTQQMRLVAVADERRREHPMSGRLQ